MTVRFQTLRELWHYRELLGFLAWRDVKVRYKQAALGASWAIIQPLFSMIIFTFLFARLASLQNQTVIPYALFSFSGLVAWTYFATTLSQAGNSLVSNSNLVTKVYFPRVLLPAAAALSGMLDILVGLAFLVVLMIYYGVYPGIGILLAPLFLLMLMLLAIGVSMLLAAMNVRYRDVKYTIPFMLQLGIFVTPIIFPLSFLPERYQTWLSLNPMAGIVEGLRMSLFAPYSLDLRLLAISGAVTLTIFVVGWIYFRKTERMFADLI